MAIFFLGLTARQVYRIVNNYRDRLTKEVKAEICALHLSGVKPAAIARKYRIPPLMVSNIVGKDKAPAPGSKKELQMEIAARILTPEVVSRIEVNKISIKATAKKIGVPAPVAAKFVDKRSEVIRKTMQNYTATNYKNDGRTDSEIALAFGVSPSFIVKWKREKGLTIKVKKRHPKDLPMSDRAWDLVRSNMVKIKYYCRRGADESFILQALQRAASISAHRDDSDVEAKKYISQCMRFASLKVNRSTQERFDRFLESG
jgi:transposase-like protein